MNNDSKASLELMNHHLASKGIESVSLTPDLISEGKRWLHYVLDGNPFYVISAVLLLYSMNRLSNGSGLFKSETSQLIFNFSSFQIYELLLVGTAVFLAGRHIWYDSGVLVCLESMFLFVPFILVSQALLINGATATLLCLTGSGLALARMMAIRRKITGMNFSRRLLILGMILLVINLAMPVLVRLLHKDVAMPEWFLRKEWFTAMGWFLAAPLLIALGWILPLGMKRGETGVEKAVFARRWFPLFTYGFWVAGTLAHFYCIGYLYGFEWNYAFLAPAIWALGWILVWRRFELGIKAGSRWEDFFLGFPLVGTVWAVAFGDMPICLSLASLNALFFAKLAIAKRSVKIFHLFLCSAALAIGASPIEWHRALGIGGGQAQWMAGIMMGWLVLLTILTRNPKCTLLGTLAVVGLVLVLTSCRGNAVGVIALQTGMAFFLLHSLCWEEGSEETARWLMGSFWMLFSPFWIFQGRPSLLMSTFVIAGIVLLVCMVMRWITGNWKPHAVLVSVSVVMTMVLGQMLFEHAKTIPEGMLILMGSFLFFGVGTVLALTKAHWHGDGQTVALDKKKAEYDALLD